MKQAVHNTEGWFVRTKASHVNGIGYNFKYGLQRFSEKDTKFAIVPAFTLGLLWTTQDWIQKTPLGVPVALSPNLYVLSVYLSLQSAWAGLKRGCEFHQDS